MLPKLCFRCSCSRRHGRDNAAEDAVTLHCLIGQPLFPLLAALVRKLSLPILVCVYFCVKISCLTKSGHSFYSRRWLTPLRHHRLLTPEDACTPALLFSRVNEPYLIFRWKKGSVSWPPSPLLVCPGALEHAVEVWPGWSTMEACLLWVCIFCPNWYSCCIFSLWSSHYTFLLI